jgi:GNAT superfamily N-acetyltransferase
MSAGLKDLQIGPMGEDFILWRCLHAGPLNGRNIDSPEPNADVDWPSARARNIPLLEKLTRTYGACAILARDGDDVVGMLRFYPKPLCEFGDSGAGFCLQQRYPAGPADELAAGRLPSFEELADKTLFVHCLFVASPRDDPDRYRRKGLATRLARELVRWAGSRGWSAIEATSYEEIPMLYAISGVAGRRFWEPLGFHVVRQDTEPAIGGDLLMLLRQDAVAAGLRAEDVVNRYRMRFDLAGRPDLP